MLSIQDPSSISTGGYVLFQSINPGQELFINVCNINNIVFYCSSFSTDGIWERVEDLSGLRDRVWNLGTGSRCCIWTCLYAHVANSNHADDQ